MMSEERKKYAQKMFAQNPELFPEDRRQSILNGIVVLGMTPFEANNSTTATKPTSEFILNMVVR